MSDSYILSFLKTFSQFLLLAKQYDSCCGQSTLGWCSGFLAFGVVAQRLTLLLLLKHVDLHFPIVSNLVSSSEMFPWSFVKL